MQKVQRKQDKLAKKFGVSPAGPPQETLDRMSKAIKYVGTRVHHPEWVIMDLGRNGHSHQVLGVVKCPCASEKKPLTEKDARKRILGQVSLIRPGLKVNTKKGHMQFRMKLAYSAFVMLDCWKKHCASGAKENLLDARFGGGSAC